jgi:serine/threonine protein kinase
VCSSDLRFNILHQDIKPANILVDQVNMVAKICDLGLAKIRSFDVASTTNAIQVAGTPQYMAPERLLKQDRATPACDIWSLGITLCEWLTGEDPWNLQEQDDEPTIFIRCTMQRGEKPHVFTVRDLKLLQPCVEYIPSRRPSARHLLQRFQCPSCSKLGMS